MKFIDLTGKSFGKLTVIKRVENKNDEICWLCKCDCGNEKVIFGKNLRKGFTTSCGCTWKEAMLQKHTKHGLARTRLDNIFCKMKERCYSKNNPAYKDYGGRGICICDEWLNDKTSFFKWATENGYKENLTIDRIDNNGNYEPSNCRWVDIETQCNNRRSNHNITFKGETHNIKGWSKKLGITASSITCRLRKGWSIERALTTPQMKNQYC